jgi:hypothetical protein
MLINLTWFDNYINVLIRCIYYIWIYEYTNITNNIYWLPIIITSNQHLSDPEIFYNNEL